MVGTNQSINKKYNKSAIIGFVFSIVGVLIPILIKPLEYIAGAATLVGFALGISALLQIKRTGEKGKGLAITSIIFGSLAIIGIVSAIILVSLRN